MFKANAVQLKLTNSLTGQSPAEAASTERRPAPRPPAERRSSSFFGSSAVDCWKAPQVWNIVSGWPWWHSRTRWLTAVGSCRRLSEWSRNIIDVDCHCRARIPRTLPGQCRWDAGPGSACRETEAPPRPGIKATHLESLHHNPTQKSSVSLGGLGQGNKQSVCKNILSFKNTV